MQHTCVTTLAYSRWFLEPSSPKKSQFDNLEGYLTRLDAMREKDQQEDPEQDLCISLRGIFFSLAFSESAPNDWQGAQEQLCRNGPVFDAS